MYRFFLIPMTFVFLIVGNVHAASVPSCPTKLEWLNFVKTKQTDVTTFVLRKAMEQMVNEGSNDRIAVVFKVSAFNLSKPELSVPLQNLFAKDKAIGEDAGPLYEKIVLNVPPNSINKSMSALVIYRVSLRVSSVKELVEMSQHKINLIELGTNDQLKFDILGQNWLDHTNMTAELLDVLGMTIGSSYAVRAVLTLKDPNQDIQAILNEQVNGVNVVSHVAGSPEVIIEGTREQLQSVAKLKDVVAAPLKLDISSVTVVPGH